MKKRGRRSALSTHQLPLIVLSIPEGDPVSTALPLFPSAVPVALFRQQLPSASPIRRRSPVQQSHSRHGAFASDELWSDARLQRYCLRDRLWIDRKSTRLNSSHRCISYAVFCLKKKI